jgi:hypothetical protein
VHVIVIDAEVPRFTVVSSLDLGERQGEPELSRSVQRFEDLARARSAPGFVGAVLLAGRPQDSEPSAPGLPGRLLEYSQWESSAAYRAELARAGSLDLANPNSDTYETLGTYELDAVVAAKRRLEVTAGNPLLTMVVSMQARAGQQAFVNTYNQDDTRDYFSTFNGFVGVAFHLGSGDRVLEYLQWESLRAMEAANRTERFRTHLATNAQLCVATEFGVYDVISTISADDRP